MLVHAEPAHAQEEHAQTPPFVGELFVRTGLYFGSLRPDQSHVTAEELKMFLDEVITPRFPDGLTLLTGLGQFRTASNQIIQERARLLILLYQALPPQLPIVPTGLRPGNCWRGTAHLAAGSAVCHNVRRCEGFASAR